MSYSLQMIKGYDRRGTAFTAWILCDNQADAAIRIARDTNTRIDLTGLHIVYKILGHTVSEALLKDIREYLRYFNERLIAN